MFHLFSAIQKERVTPCGQRWSYIKTACQLIKQDILYTNETKHCHDLMYLNNRHCTICEDEVKEVTFLQYIFMIRK